MGGFGENSGLRTLVLFGRSSIKRHRPIVLNWYSIPVSLVESVEVIRGGQAGTFGNHAVGGVIKINTKLPEKMGFMEVAGVLIHFMQGFLYPKTWDVWLNDFWGAGGIRRVPN